MTLPELESHIDSEYSQLLIVLLKTEQLGEAEAKNITRNYLALYPYVDIADMSKKLKQFTEHYSAFAKVYVSFLKHTEDEKTNEVLNKMRNFMKHDQLDEAIKIAT